MKSLHHEGYKVRVLYGKSGFNTPENMGEKLPTEIKAVPGTMGADVHKLFKGTVNPQRCVRAQR